MIDLIFYIVTELSEYTNQSRFFYTFSFDFYIEYDFTLDDIILEIKKREKRINCVKVSPNIIFLKHNDRIAKIKLIKDKKIELIIE